ncbi:hypothetical protein N032_13630 [Pseudomonas syringae pv. pisi str. PP1]|uniref:hypothetical protein n=1 Tax=Pseudomonas syringae TaxID=317 RepID=UPI0004649F16|nr:hypothetical protein [Pseudomonas syringae]AZG86602.1 hypothetical protein N032_13630 [Pseudomonas syringae pv. pisi str. PP1]UZS65036.1 hypothetical protein OQB64_13170 [Pseudomonas syringae]
MKPDISEFSYGFAVTSEAVTMMGSSISAAPQFPTQYVEGRAGGGYDVKITGGTAIFLQFKLSHFMSRSNCKEHLRMGGPYYRWHLHARTLSYQHDLLLSLESKGNLVAYTAPMFHRSAELNHHYLNDQILDNSAAFRPSQIKPLPDDENHYVVFNRTGPAYRCSEDPVEVEFDTLNSFLRGLAAKPVQEDLESEGGIRLGEDIIDSMKVARSQRGKGFQALGKEIDTDEIIHVIRTRPTLATLSLISRTVLDAELLVLNPQWHKVPKRRS